MIDGGYDIDLEAVNQNVEEAEVVTFYFPMLRRTLLVDMRCGPLEGPLICVVAMVDSSAQRYESLRRLRPQLPRPESLTMIPWAHSIGALEETGVWDRVTGRLLECGAADVLVEAGRCLRELRVLELNELRLAIRGPEYRTVWGRAGVGDGAEPPAAV
ncbi:MAG: hypothetical protein K1X87_07360 [Dehalococcoidia bacterium]|nr:hypothetical protein [Dehalococcoidia bacterium]